MKMFIGGCVVVLLAMLFPLSSSPAGELDEQLQFLEPLIGKNWIGGFVGSEAPDIEIVLRFEKILDGRAVRYVREVDSANFSGLTQFFWNPGNKEVCFISLNNRGIVGEGVVLVTDGRIVLLGKSHRPDKTTEFKTTLEVGPQGTLSDSFQRLEGSEWVQGHIQEFAAEE